MSEKLKDKEVSPEIVEMLKTKGLTPIAGTEQPQPQKNLITSEDIQQFINNKKTN